MKAVIAIDSFKESLTSLQAGHAAAAGIRAAMPEAETRVIPLADGGEGTMEALLAGLGGERISLRVTGPLGESIDSSYGLLSDGKTAVMEMALAAGLPLVPAGQRNPLHTTTFGVGELILDALDRGCREFFIGIGGSATNDGGLGMLSALGARFHDPAGKPVGIFGRDVERTASADLSTLDPRLADCRFRIACDVSNPLCGPNGASAVFGPQKGASAEIVARLDAALAAFARLLGEAAALLPGSGAAGGLGYAFRLLPHAELLGGAELVCDITGLERAIQAADIVVTGEGRLDEQTTMGKGPGVVARLAAKHARPVIAFAGCLADSALLCNRTGIDAFFAIQRGPATLEEALDIVNAEANLHAAAEQAFRLIAAAKRL